MKRMKVEADKFHMSSEIEEGNMTSTLKSIILGGGNLISSVVNQLTQDSSHEDHVFISKSPKINRRIKLKGFGARLRANGETLVSVEKEQIGLIGKDGEMSAIAKPPEQNLTFNDVYINNNIILATLVKRDSGAVAAFMTLNKNDLTRFGLFQLPKEGHSGVFFPGDGEECLCVDRQGKSISKLDSSGASDNTFHCHLPCSSDAPDLVDVRLNHICRIVVARSSEKKKTRIMGFDTQTGLELWSHKLSWSKSRKHLEKSDLSWQEQHEQILLLNKDYLLYARHWTRTTSAGDARARSASTAKRPPVHSARHERYEMNLLETPGGNCRQVGIVTGTQESPLCCGSENLVTWWLPGSQHGGLSETIKAYQISTNKSCTLDLKPRNTMKKRKFKVLQRDMAILTALQDIKDHHGKPHLLCLVQLEVRAEDSGTNVRIVGINFDEDEEDGGKVLRKMYFRDLKLVMQPKASTLLHPPFHDFDTSRNDSNIWRRDDQHNIDGFWLEDFFREGSYSLFKFDGEERTKNDEMEVFGLSDTDDNIVSVS